MDVEHLDSDGWCIAQLSLLPKVGEGECLILNPRLNGIINWKKNNIK